MTYNVAGLPQQISGSDPETNSPLISPLLNAYDVVLLQEDWEDPIEAAPVVFFHDEIVSQADHPYQSEPMPHPMGLDMSRFPTGPPMLADGLNQLSRFPFGTIERHHWEACYGEFAVEVLEVIVDSLGLSGPVGDAGLGDVVDGGSSDCGALKGFTVSRLQVAPGVEVDLYNLHADAGGGERDAEARASNFAQLASFMRSHSKDRAVIVGGDTNLHTEPDSTRPTDVKVWSTFLAATGATDVCEVAECGEHLGIIDKFAFRNGVGVSLVPVSYNVEIERFKRDDGEPLSDHDAVAVRFAWESGTADDPNGQPVLPLTGGAGGAPLFAVILIAPFFLERSILLRRSRSMPPCASMPRSRSRM